MGGRGTVIRPVMRGGVQRGGMQQIARGGMQQMGRGGMQQMSRGGMQVVRGGMVNRPRMAQPVMTQPQARRGRPPSNSTIMMQPQVGYVIT